MDQTLLANGHTLFGKTKLCYTEVEDFTNFQGIGRDPLYKRFDSVYSVISKHIEPQYRDFLAHPIYSEKDQIEWYVCSWNELPCAYKDLPEADKVKYTKIKEETIAAYKKVNASLTNTEEKQILTGALKYIDEDYMYCFDDKVVLIAWGMTPESQRHVAKGLLIHDLKFNNTHKIRFIVGDKGQLSDKLAGTVSRPNGFMLSSNDLPHVIAKKGFVFKGWKPNPLGVKVTGPLSFTAAYDIDELTEPEKVRVTFIAEESGDLKGRTEYTIEKGTCLTHSQIPAVQPNPGFKFTGWDVEPDGLVINHDTTFTAKFDKDDIKCCFNAGECGVIEGVNSFLLPQGTIFSNAQVPRVKAKKGYKFVGWDISPVDFILNEDTTFTAQYEKVVPWYASYLNKGCLTRLLWLLLTLLLLFLLFWLLKDASCACSRDDSSAENTDDSIEAPNDTIIETPDDGNIYDPYNPDKPGGIYNPEDPYTLPPTDSTYSDVLPPSMGVLPPIDDGDMDPDNPYIVSNRLNILMENSDKPIGELARAFKQHYPADEYQVIYYDDVVKRIQVTVPPNKREVLKQEIPSKLAPEFEVFVFDESLFELSYIPNDPIMNDASKSWYLKAIHATEAWDISTGSEDIVVAIVDNGFNLSHPELKEKVYKPYNVWKHNADVPPARSTDHGTHVAGTVLAMGNNSIGISGIAPKCKFMPIKVADDNEFMTITSVLDGILYAIYQGADVVNVSLGYTIRELLNKPEDVQQVFIDNRLKEEERLWREVIRIASSRNVTIVVAAGNDNVLAGIDPLQRPDDVIVVAALDKNLTNLDKANFSNYGDYATVSAPGVSIYSTVGQSGYETMDGTSMAAPIITGSVALMKSISPNITTKQIKCIFNKTSIPVNDKVPGLIQLNKALAAVKQGNFGNCDVEPSTGDVQIKLQWDNYNDLDLLCKDPSGQVISYKNKRSTTGGLLEIDMNVSYPDNKRPIENIYWPTHSAPSGTYTVFVNYYKNHESPIETPYKVMVKHGNITDEYTGTLTRVKDKQMVCSFSVDSENEGNDHRNSRIDSLRREKDRLEEILRRIDEELRRQ